MQNANTPRKRLSRRAKVFWIAGSLTFVMAMNGFAYAAVPAYRAFCQAIGFAGIPLRAVEAPAADAVIDRDITVRFNTDVSADLAWRFKPVQRSVDLKVGETGLAYFEATNLSDRQITGTATFNVTPLKVAPYFVKIECFCFTQQTLAPGETAQMPVTFFVDPDIAEERNVADVRTITLSYTFFVDPDAEQEKLTHDLSAAVLQGQHPEHRHQHPALH